MLPVKNIHLNRTTVRIRAIEYADNKQPACHPGSAGKNGDQHRQEM